MRWLKAVGRSMNGLRAMLLLFLASVLTHSTPALAQSGALERSKYQVFTADLNGDGKPDLLMRATPTIVPVELDDDFTLPIPVPPPTSSFILMSDNVAGYVLVANPPPEQLNAAWQHTDYKLSYAAPNGSNSGTVSITTAADQPLFQVALTSDTSQLQLVSINGTSAQNEEVTYIHTDALGSPVARTDARGNTIVSRTGYEPYGATSSGAVPTIGFTGHANDADTGLVYMQQRYYDPVVGRFLSTDPVSTETNTGDSFNRYSYASNSPYKYRDPDGRDPMDWVHGGLTAASFCPAVCGSAFSAIDGLIYGAQGQNVNASISFASAAAGVVSDAGAAKVAAMAIKEAGTAAKEVGIATKMVGESGDVLFRRGAMDTKSLLTTQAKDAERVLGVHGVSVSTSPVAKPGQVVRSADKGAVEAAGFKVTKTGGNPNHYTVELPNPITTEVSKIWNELFK